MNDSLNNGLVNGISTDKCLTTWKGLIAMSNDTTRGYTFSHLERAARRANKRNGTNWGSLTRQFYITGLFRLFMPAIDVRKLDLDGQHGNLEVFLGKDDCLYWEYFYRSGGSYPEVRERMTENSIIEPELKRDIIAALKRPI